MQMHIRIINSLVQYLQTQEINTMQPPQNPPPRVHDLVKLKNNIIEIDEIRQQYKNTIEKMNTLGMHNQCAIMVDNWKLWHIADFIKYVRCWLLPTAIFLQYNRQPQILKQISHVLFPHLTKLFLRGNRIESVQVLSEIFMPNLEVLWLGQNNIVSIRSIRKANFPNLANFTIVRNCVQQLEGFAQIKMPKLKQIDIQRDDDKNNSFSYKIFAKAQMANQKVIIWALKSRRIKQTKTFISLSKKIQGLENHVPN